MANDAELPNTNPQPDPVVSPPSPALSTPTRETRPDLLTRARSFLTSPQIQYQDLAAKRRFLLEKGISEVEVEGLLRELPPHAPTIPPRAYPQLPPSNLPNLFLGIARIFSWIAGGSAALILFYYRFLLPRISRTLLARQSLKSHQASLLQKLTTSLTELRETQTRTFAILPHPDPFKEPPKFANCRSISNVLKEAEEQGLELRDVSPVTLLRCGIRDFGRGKEGNVNIHPTTEELFGELEGKIPWLVAEEGVAYEQKLWDTLSACPLFNAEPLPTPSDTQVPSRWTYTPPTPLEPTPLLRSLTALSSSLPKDTKLRKNTNQRTLQALSDFTGYISTQVYLPYRPPANGFGLPGSVGLLSPAEEDVKREIRALKGLVLNRRSFMPSIPRAGSYGVQRATP